jgi:hypothetical protein
MAVIVPGTASGEKGLKFLANTVLPSRPIVKIVLPPLLPPPPLALVPLPEHAVRTKAPARTVDIDAASVLPDFTDIPPLHLLLKPVLGGHRMVADRTVPSSRRDLRASGSQTTRPGGQAATGSPESAVTIRIDRPALDFAIYTSRILLVQVLLVRARYRSYVDRSVLPSERLCQEIRSSKWPENGLNIRRWFVRATDAWSSIAK